MTYYLDTSTCISFIRGDHPDLINSIMTHNPNDIHVPSVVVAELTYGANKSFNASKNTEITKEFLAPYKIVPLDGKAAEIYSDIRASLETEGKVIGIHDMMIAATVISNGGILVTIDISDFSRISNLLIEDWSLSWAGATSKKEEPTDKS